MGTCSDIVGLEWEVLLSQANMGNMVVDFQPQKELAVHKKILDVRYSTFNIIQPLCLMFRAELEIDPARRVLRQYETNIIWISQELFGPLGARDMI